MIVTHTERDNESGHEKKNEQLKIRESKTNCESCLCFTDIWIDKNRQRRTEITNGDQVGRFDLSYKDRQAVCEVGVEN